METETEINFVFCTKQRGLCIPSNTIVQHLKFERCTLTCIIYLKSWAFMDEGDMYGWDLVYIKVKVLI